MRSWAVLVITIVALTLGACTNRDDKSAAREAGRTAHKIAIECMAHLDQLPPTGATLVLGPLQLQNGSGSPLSITAFVP